MFHPPGPAITKISDQPAVVSVQSKNNNTISCYPRIPKILEDGIYGPETANAVRIFQEIFNLPVTGVVDIGTWYRISRIYVGVTGMGV